MMGAPVPPDALSRHDGMTPFSTLTTIGESPIDAQVLYAGATMAGAGDERRRADLDERNVEDSRAAAVHVRQQRAAVAARGGPRLRDVRRPLRRRLPPYVYVSDDYGQTWRSIVAGLPATGVNRIREHPSDPHFLLLGHERGIHFSIDGGRDWSPLTLVTNMPTVPVDDILIHPRENDSWSARTAAASGSSTTSRRWRC